MSLTTVKFKVANHPREIRNVGDDELTEIFSKKQIQQIVTENSEFEILFHDGSRILIESDDLFLGEQVGLDIDISVEL